MPYKKIKLPNKNKYKVVNKNRGAKNRRKNQNKNA